MSHNEPLRSVEGIAEIAELGAAIPGVGTPLAIIAAVTRAGQGNVTGAGTNLAMAVPFGGLLKGARTATHATEEAHSVYVGVDEITGVVRYVGRTGRDPAIRFAEHAASGTERAGLTFRVVDGATGLTRMQARAWEQGLINSHGLGKNGGTLFNKINSVAPKYWGQFGIR
jgi:hypothetical protein